MRWRDETLPTSLAPLLVVLAEAYVHACLVVPTPVKPSTRTFSACRHAPERRHDALVFELRPALRSPYS